MIAFRASQTFFQSWLFGLKVMPAEAPCQVAKMDIWRTRENTLRYPTLTWLEK